MSVTPLECVVDASVGIKLFVQEPLSEEAHTLFAHLADAPPALLYVPELFFIECANVLWKYVQRYGYPKESAAEDVAALVRLPLVLVPNVALVEDALTIAMRTGCTAYDATYVALAQHLGLPLITADEALVRRFAGTGTDVLALGAGL